MLIDVEKRFNMLGDKLRVYRQGLIIDFLTFSDLLEKENITTDDVQWYVDRLTENIKHEVEQKEKEIRRIPMVTKDQEFWEKVAKHCPDCNALLRLEQVSAAIGKANIHGYRGVWRCVNGDCVYEEYIKEYPQEIYDKLMGR